MTAELESYLSLLESDPDSERAMERIDTISAAAVSSRREGQGAEATSLRNLREMAQRVLGSVRRSARERGDVSRVMRALTVELRFLEPQTPSEATPTPATASRTLTGMPGSSRPLVSMGQNIAVRTDADRAADLFYEKGRVLLDELLDDVAAEACFAEALTLVPTHKSALEATSRNALLRGNFEPIAQKYEADAEAALAQDDKAMASSYLVSAAEMQLRYGRPDRTASLRTDGSVESAAGEAGPDAAGEKLLRRALELDAQNRRATLLLERRLRSRGATEELTSLLSARLSDASGADRLRVLAELADLDEKRGDSRAAREKWREVLAEEPTHGRALRAEVEALAAEGDWNKAARLYEAALAKQPRSEVEATLILQLGQIYWKRLSDMDRAEPLFRRVRKAAPDHRLALEFYRAFFTARGDRQKLLDLLGQASRATSDQGRRLELLVEMARSAAEDARMTEKAADLWKAVLRSSPGHAEATSALGLLYRRAEKWNALLELLKERVDALPADALADKIDLSLEIADIYQDRLGLDVMVVATYQNVLALDPAHRPALAALAKKYEQMGRWSDLVGVLQRQSELSEGEEKVELLRQMAQIWLGKFANANQAVKPLEELLILAPGDAHAMGLLRDAYLRRRDAQAVLSLDVRLLEQLEAPERKSKLVEMAKLAQERLSDVRLAISLWNRLLKLDPADTVALNQLASLYERDKRFPALCEILQRQAQLESDPQRRANLLERAGTLFAERLEAEAPAMACFKQVIALAPDHPRALRALRDYYTASGDSVALEELYSRAGLWSELVESLLGAVEKAEGSATKIKLLLRVAELSEEKLGQPQQAVKPYERVLALDPAHVEAARRLLPIYRKAEKWARVLATEEVVLGHTTDPTERAAMLAEMQFICERRLGSKGLAFQWSCRRYELQPNDESVIGDVERLADEAGGQASLRALYAERIKETSDEKEKLLLSRRLGRLLRKGPSHAEETAEHYRQVLAISPTDGEALEALREVYQASGQWRALVDVLEQTLVAEREVSGRLKQLLELARIEEERLGDLAAATSRYAQALTLARKQGDKKETRTIVVALERLFLVQQKWVELVELLSEHAGHETEARVRAQLWIRQAEIYDDQLGNPSLAMGLYGQALEVVPSDPRLRNRLLGKLDPKDGQKPKEDASEIAISAARALLAALSGDRPHPDLVRVLEVLLAAEKDPAERQLMRGRLVALCERLSLFDRAFPVVAAQVEENPTGREAARMLYGLAEKMSDWSRYVAFWERVWEKLPSASGSAEAEGAGDASQRRTQAAELAEIYEQRLDDLDRAVFWHRRRLEELGDVRAAGDLERIFRQTQNWSALRSFYSWRLEREEDPLRKRGLLIEQAMLSEKQGQQGDQGDEAVALYRQALVLDPRDDVAQAALERILFSRGKFKEYDALLEERIENTDDPLELGALRFRRAEVRGARLGDAQGAVALLEQVLEADPRHEGAARALERLMARKELRGRIARTLERAYDRMGAYAKLVAILQVRSQESGAADHDGDEVDAEEALDLLVRVAQLQEQRLSARQAAFLTWREVLRRRPGLEEARGNVERLGTMLERWIDLAQAWEEAQALCAPADIAAKADLLVRIAKLCEGPLADEARATVAWRRVIELGDAASRKPAASLATSGGASGEAEAPAEGHKKGPGSAPLEGSWREAALALRKIYARTGAYVDLVHLISAEVVKTSDRLEKSKLLIERAGLEATRIRDVQAAVGSYRMALDLDPQNADALDALERLYRVDASAAEQLDVLRRKAALAEQNAAPSAAQVAERQALLRRIAELEERDLGLVADAASTYRKLLDEAPGDLPALRALIRLSENLGRWLEVDDLLSRELALTPPQDSAGRITLLARMAQVEADRLSLMGRAHERYLQILELSPDDPRAMAGLERSLGEPALAVAAAQALEPYYDKTNALEPWAELCMRMLELERDTAGQASRLRTLAKIEERRHAGGQALDAYLALLPIATADEDFEALAERTETLASSLHRQADLIAVYRKLAPEIIDSKRAARLWRVVAEMSRGPLGDRDLGAEAYRRVLELDANDDAALAALADIYTQRAEAEGGSQYQALLEILERRAAVTTDARLKREVLSRAARVCMDHLDAPTEAITLYERVLEIDPTDGDAMEGLRRLYTEMQRFTELADLLERRLQVGGSLDETVRVRMRLGNLFATELDDPERAVEAYCAVLAIPGIAQAPVLSTGQPRRSETAPGQGGHDGASLVPAPPPALAAIDALERFLDVDAVRERAAEALESVYAARQDWVRLLHVYRVRLGATDAAEVRLQLLRRIAQISEEQLEDLEAAFQVYTEVFALRPGDVGVLGQLERLAGVLGRWEELAGVLDGWLSDRLDTDEQARMLCMRVANIYEVRLGRPLDAARFYERVLLEEPDNLALVRGLESVLRDANAYPELVELYERTASRQADPTEAGVWLATLARLHEERGQVGEAAATYRRIVDVQGDQAGAQVGGALLRLLEAEQDWSGLSVELHRQLASATGETATALQYRLGTLFEGELGDMASALDAFEAVLSRDPSHAGSRSALERMASANDEMLALRALRQLAELRRREGDPSALLAVFERMLERIEDPAERGAIWLEMADVCEGESRFDLAWSALANAFLERPESALLERLEASAHKWSKWREFSATLIQARELMMESSLRAGVLARLATCLETVLQDREGAIPVWQEVLELGVSEGDSLEVPNAELGRPSVRATERASEALGALYAQQGRHAERVALVERRAELADTPETRMAHLRRAATLATEQRLIEEATALWERVLDESADLPGTDAETDTEGAPIPSAQAAAQEALERLYGDAERWNDLVGLLGRRTSEALSTPEAIERCRQAWLAQAKIQEEHLDSPEQAVVCYEAIRDLGAMAAAASTAAPGDGSDANLGSGTSEAIFDVSTLEALDRLYGRLGRSLDLQTVLEMRIAGARDLGERAHLRVRLGQLLEEAQGDGEGALGQYAAALSEAPADAAVLERISNLLASETTRLRAAELLGPIYAGAENHAALIDLWERCLEVEGEPERRRVLFARMAELAEKKLNGGDTKLAFELWGRLFAEAPDDGEARAALERLGAERGAYVDLALLYEDRLTNLFEPELGRTLALRLAGLYETALGDTERAIDKLRVALDYPGDQAPILATLDRLLEQVGRFEEQAEVLTQRVAATAAEPNLQAELGCRLGELRASRLGDSEGSLEAYRQVLELAPDHPGAKHRMLAFLVDPYLRARAVEVLEPICTGEIGGKRDTVALAAVIKARIEMAEPGPERARLFVQLAESHEADMQHEGSGATSRQMTAAEAALTAWGQALVEDPADPTALSGVLRLGHGHGTSEQPKLGRPAAQALEKAAAVAAGTDEALLVRELLLKAAGLWIEIENDKEAAELCLVRVLEQDDADTEALEQLESLVRERQDPTGLARVLWMRSKAELDAGRRKACLEEVGRLAEAEKNWGLYGQVWEALIEAEGDDPTWLKNLVLAYDKGQSSRSNERLVDPPAPLALLSLLDRWAAVENDKPTAAAALARAGTLLAKSGDVQGAISRYEQALEFVPGDGDVSEALAALYRQAGDDDGLERLLRSELEAASPGPGAATRQVSIVMELHKMATARGDTTAAIELAEQALALDPTHAALGLALAESQLAQGDTEAATTRLSAIDPGRLSPTQAAELHFLRGNLAAGQAGSKDAGESEWRRAVEACSAPTHAGARSALEELARTRSDAASLAKLLELRLAETQDQLGRGQVAIELGQLYLKNLANPSAAVRAFEVVLASNPGDLQASVDAVQMLAEATEQVGSIPAAAQVLERYLAGLQGKRTREVARLEARLASLLERLDKPDEALSRYETAFAADPTNGPTLVGLGRLYLARGQLEAARRIFRSMLLQDLDRDAGMTKADAYLALGRICMREGEVPKARNFFERGLELDPQHVDLREALAQATESAR